MTSENQTHEYDGQDRRQNDELTQYRLSMIERNLEALTKTMQDNADSMKVLVSLEQKHAETREAIARAFRELDTHTGQIRAMEIEMPTIKLVRGWVIAGVIGVFAIFGTQVVSITTPVSANVEVSVPFKGS